MLFFLLHMLYRSVIMNILIRSSHDPRKKANEPHGVAISRLKNTGLEDA